MPRTLAPHWPVKTNLSIEKLRLFIDFEDEEDKDIEEFIVSYLVDALLLD